MKKQKGIALITALLVTSIATITAISMMSRQHLDLRRSSNIFASDQAWLYVQGVESWAVQIMFKDREDSSSDHLGEDWATELPPIIVEGGVLAGKIEDLQGRFNLNNLLQDGIASQPDIAILKRLFTVLDIDSRPVLAIVDWIDADGEETYPNGAEDNVYLGAGLNYRTANNIMASPSELLLIDGIEYDDYQSLRPFLSALPQRTAINVNTASAEVLQALVAGLDGGDARQLVDEREDNPFESIQEFRSHSLIAPHLKNKSSNNGHKNRNAGFDRDGDEESYDEKSMAVSSDYYLLQASAKVGRTEVHLASIINRDEKGAQIIMHGQGNY